MFHKILNKLTNKSNKDDARVGSSTQYKGEVTFKKNLNYHVDDLIKRDTQGLFKCPGALNPAQYTSVVSTSHEKKPWEVNGPYCFKDDDRMVIFNRKTGGIQNLDTFEFLVFPGIDRDFLKKHASKWSDIFNIEKSRGNYIFTGQTSKVRPDTIREFARNKEVWNDIILFPGVAPKLDNEHRYKGCKIELVLEKFIPNTETHLECLDSLSFRYEPGFFSRGKYHLEIMSPSKKKISQEITQAEDLSTSSNHDDTTSLKESVKAVLGDKINKNSSRSKDSKAR